MSLLNQKLQMGPQIPFYPVTTIPHLRKGAGLPIKPRGLGLSFGYYDFAKGGWKRGRPPIQP